MKLFECHPFILHYESPEALLAGEAIGPGDLVLTSRSLAGMADPLQGAQVLYQEDYGEGEPTDEMLLRLLEQAERPYTRVIGIGGGTVMDLAKLLCLELQEHETAQSLHALFTGERPAEKRCALVLVPTTCGTGSEVTCVSVLLFTGLHMKLGLSHPALYADRAALVPSLLETLPRRPLLLSAVDALIHACESALSPRANALTLALSEEAVRMILWAFRALAGGAAPSLAMRGALLEAATMAGLAFGNAGCGAVHAMSYPIGGEYHLPHGEANAVVFLPVLRFYDAQEHQEPLLRLKALLAGCLDCGEKDALQALDHLLDSLSPWPRLSALGATEEDLRRFASEVYRRQGRLLSGAMVPMTEKDICAVYHTA